VEYANDMVVALQLMHFAVVMLKLKLLHSGHLVRCFLA
jgi:hypothetical protein